MAEIKKEPSFFERHGQKVLGGAGMVVGFMFGGPLGAAALGAAGVYAADKMKQDPDEVTGFKEEPKKEVY